jgi:hypothetical protein
VRLLGAETRQELSRCLKVIEGRHMVGGIARAGPLDTIRNGAFGMKRNIFEVDKS